MAFILKTLKDVFLLLPSSVLYSETPRVLPREIYHTDIPVDSNAKKAGRPTKREATNKVRIAVNQLDKWVESSPYPIPDIANDLAGAPAGVKALYTITPDDDDEGVVDDQQEGETPETTTHILLSHRPVMSLHEYRQKKVEMVAALQNHGTNPLLHASDKIVARLQHIDRMAAERGLEVGSEGGDLSGLGRVEKASRDFANGKNGLLGLLEGSGLE